MAVIKTKDIYKTYNPDTIPVHAVNGIDLEIKEGEFTAIVGPSGCGKTTLLNIIGGLDRPTSGYVEVGGQDISKLSDNKLIDFRKDNIGFVFQSFNLIDELTVFENIELPLLYLGVSPANRKKCVNEMLEQLELMPRKNHFPQQISGGQQQRVAVARAVIANPKMILADEPTGNLDSSHGDDVMRILVDLNENGTTIVMVTHSPAYADYANRVIHLFDGHIVTENLKEKYDRHMRPLAEATG